MSDSVKSTNAPAKPGVKKGRWGRLCIFFLTGGFFCANVFVEGVEYTTLETVQKVTPPSKT